ncbi:hypothetical protein P7K49_030336 [Saguinus oedipus]|uniref:Uncharacterized protein n=1 Tax=Saguinus oedipus TaxID=9490 RepID=A0ABQ9U1V4_SAGOE|nr:hypothetical protein P7K49_030336 [Saguinus oedipus]
MVEDGAEELEDLVHFSVSELPSRGYGVMEEIRRQGKLCDVTLKVPRAGRQRAEVKGVERAVKRGGDREREVSRERRREKRFEGGRVVEERGAEQENGIGAE